MPTIHELKDLANIRLEEVKSLFAGELYDGAWSFHMDKKALVKHLHSIIDRFEKEGKPFNLVMLIPVDPVLNNKFSILWSAAWIDGMTRSEAIHVLVEAIAAEMRSDDSKFEKIARVTPLRSTDPFVTEIIEEYEVKKGSLRMPNSY
ncbi:MAG: hypothetical protein HQK59_14120, partial [Deltaproteobacteria bacterium]|nr:hypothetical protein [Deltaproteobacteria bacterium]